MYKIYNLREKRYSYWPIPFKTKEAAKKEIKNIVKYSQGNTNPVYVLEETDFIIVKA